MCQTLQLSLDSIFSFHSLKQLRTGKLSPRSDNNGRGSIMLTDQCDTLLYLCIGHTVGVTQNDASGVFNLIIEKLTEIFHIHLTFVGVHYGRKAVQNRITTVILHTLHGTNNVTQLADTGGLDQNAVGMIFIQCFFQSSSKITNKAAADTSGIHLGHFNAGILHEAAVNADLTEFIFDQHQLFILICLAQHFFDQRGFTGTEKAGENINFSHMICPLFCGFVNLYNILL